VDGGGVTQIIADKPAARWLPARHRFAITRLIVFAVGRYIPSRMNAEHMLLAVDRDQSAIENYTISILFLATSACYVGAALPLSLAWSIVLAIPIAAFVIQLPIYFGATSAILMALQFCAAAYFATAIGPIHYVAWLSLMVFATNAMAWVVDRACGI
jgi:hypothetical protein